MLLNCPACCCEGGGSRAVISCSTGQPAPAQSKLLSRAQGGAWQGPWPESEKGAAVAPTSARESPAQQRPPQLSPWAKRQAPGGFATGSSYSCPGEKPLLWAPMQRRLNSLASSQEPREHNSPLSARSWGDTEPLPHPTPQGSSLTGEPS